MESEGWTYDKDKAVEILEGELKAKKGSDGIYVLPDGTKLGGWKVICPTGWTDWNTALEIVAKSAQEVGIGITTEFPQAPTMDPEDAERRLRHRHERLLRRQPGQPVDPLPRRPRRPRACPPSASGPSGTTAASRTPRSPALLDAAPAAKSDDEAKTAYAALDKIYREKIPCVPLMYRPLEFYEFNQSNWEDFPTEENPYAPPMWQGAGIQWLFKIKRVGG